MEKTYIIEDAQIIYSSYINNNDHFDFLLEDYYEYLLENELDFEETKIFTAYTFLPNDKDFNKMKKLKENINDLANYYNIDVSIIKLRLNYEIEFEVTYDNKEKIRQYILQ